MKETEELSASIIRGTQVTGVGEEKSILTHKQVLIVVAGSDKGKKLSLESPRILIGTHTTNDLILTDPTVSRRHCEIIVRGDKYIIRDLGSTNGTTVNGLEVVEAFIPPGARLGLGNTILTFQPKKRWIRVTPSTEDHFGDLWGISYKMKEVFGILEKVALTDLSVVLIGETGTGKELAARAIHNSSKRKDKPFVVVDCGSISPTLIESELFGHERGAFTGAEKARSGAFEVANGGTIFLDEIGELPPLLQPKLLRALEQREVRRLGSNKMLNVDVRVISATNREIEKEVKEGSFREDLFYRLAEVVVNLPPLRDRREDIPYLINIFLTQERHLNQVTFTDRLLEHLASFPWNGNVRELKNFLRKILIMINKPVIDIEDIPPEIIHHEKMRVSWDKKIDTCDYLPIKEARERWTTPMEREYLIKILRRCQGDIDKVSALAGIHRKSVERLMRKHNIKIEDIL